jgi:hypothetical protein
VLAGRTSHAVRALSSTPDAHGARTSHAGHRRIDTVPLPHGGWSLWYIVGVNGSFERDASNFVNDPQWVEAAPNADHADVVVMPTSALDPLCGNVVRLRRSA